MMVVSAEKKVTLDTIGNKGSLGKKGVKSRYEKKRAAKAITKATMHRMFGLQESPLLGDYRQAYMCNEYLFQDGKKMTSNYCKKKCCGVCNRIRSAQHLSKYGAKILDLRDLHLVTLTNKNVEQDGLIDEGNRMFTAWKRIRRNMVKTYQKRINGYRSFECTYNWRTGFNPHFHFVVSGREEGELLIRLWLDQFPDADRRGQDIRAVQPTKKSLLEVFKYVSKPVTKGYYSSKAYDTIMQVAKQHRVTEALGSIRGGVESADTLVGEELRSQTIDFKGERIEVWKYVTELYDYVAPDGELLLGTPIDKKTLNAISIIEKSIIENEEKEDFRKKEISRIMWRNRTQGGVLF